LGENQGLFTIAAGEWFIAIAMCLLALQKLKDVDSFATMFLKLLNPPAIDGGRQATACALRSAIGLGSRQPFTIA
jgi:hypothetical protein